MNNDYDYINLTSEELNWIVYSLFHTIKSDDVIEKEDYHELLSLGEKLLNQSFQNCPKIKQTYLNQVAILKELIT